MWDVLEQKIFNLGIPVFFLVFIFVSFDQRIELLYLSTFIFFLILFFLSAYWAKEAHADLMYLIGFFVSIIHTFVFFFSGLIGIILSVLFNKLSILFLDFYRVFIRNEAQIPSVTVGVDLTGAFFWTQLLKNWWWVIFSFVAFLLARFFYFWWVRWEIFYKRAFKWIVLEIIPPAEVLKPFSAMENVFSMLFGVYDSPNWRERWCVGALPLGAGGWFSFEIASFGGEIHFYLRLPQGFKTSAEAAIYSQYPEIEIREVEDPIEKFPKNIPNEKWDLFCLEYVLVNPDYYPIKTYTMFFERESEEKRVLEEKRIDPMDALLEQLSKLLPGDNLIIQITCNPITSEFPWKEEAKREINKIAGRPVPPPSKPYLQQLIEKILLIKPSSSSSSSSLIAPELRMTPGEKEVVTAIENKIKKTAFETWIRMVYLCKKDLPYNYGSARLFSGYITSQFAFPKLNTFYFFGATRTRIHYWFKDRRLYLRKRQRWREAIERVPSFFPWNLTGEPPPLIKFLTLFGYRIPPGRRSISILNVEELATIFHFPAKIKIPSIARVEAKKVGPPPQLPVK